MKTLLKILLFAIAISYPTFSRATEVAGFKCSTCSTVRLEVSSNTNSASMIGKAKYFSETDGNKMFWKYTPGGSGSTTTVFSVDPASFTIYGDFNSTTTPKSSVWLTYTPTGTWTTNVTYTGFYRRIGDTLEIICQAAISGAVGVGGTFTCEPPNPATWLLDTAKVPSQGATVGYWQGDGKILDSGTAFFWAVPQANVPATGIRMSFISITASQGQASTVSDTNPITSASGDRYWVHWWKPILGWTNNTGN